MIVTLVIVANSDLIAKELISIEYDCLWREESFY